MARHGENIRKRKDGRWEGRFLIYSQEKGKKIYRSVYAPTYDEVRRKLSVQKNLITNAALGSESSICLYQIKFSDAAKEWLNETQTRCKLSTYIKYSKIYSCHIEQPFKGAVLSEITERYVSERVSSHLSDSICKSIYCVLNQILKFSFRRYHMAMPALKKRVSSISNKSVDTLTKTEQKRLVAALCQETDIFKNAVLICLLTGLRLGELCALKWSDVDLRSKILTVNRTVQRLSAEGCHTTTILIETAPKSICSKREIPLSETVLDVFTNLQNGKEYIFGGDKPLEPRTIQYRFKRILKDAKLPDKNFHILRHTFSTNCIEGGTDVKSLSEMLGHSNVQITLNRYVHPSMDTKRHHMNELSRFYGQLCGQAILTSPSSSQLESLFAD